MSDHPENLNGTVNPSVKYEQSDLSLRAVLTFGLALIVVLAVISAGLWMMIPLFTGPISSPKPLSPWKFEDRREGNASHLPARPQLEAIDQNPPGTGSGGTHTRTIQQQIAEEEDHLNSYGWVDEKKGTVYIPIEAAMERLGGRPTPGPAPRPDEGRGQSAVSTSGQPEPGGNP
jgi:hypothetical protein